MFASAARKSKPTAAARDVSKTRKTRADRPAKPVKSTYLRAVSLAYLAQRSSSRAMLKRVLTRRATNRMKVRQLDETTMDLIETALDNLVDLGLLDDKSYAAGRVSSLKQKGLSKKRVALMMQIKGLDRQTIAGAIGDELDDLTQARRFAERKRLGPWRSSASMRSSDPDRNKKDLLILQRAGFPYAIAKTALSGE